MEYVTLEEAVGETLTLAHWLSEQPQPLILRIDPTISIKPQRAANLIRLLFQAGSQ